MRTHLVRAALASAIFLAATTSNAQAVSTDRPLQIGFMLGGAAATGSYSGGQIHNTAGVIGLEVQVPLPPRRLAVRGDLAYFSFFGTNCLLVGGFRPCFNNPIVDLVPMSANLVARLNDPSTRWSPYLLGGAALYLTSSGGNVGPTPPGAGLQAGLGFEVRPATRTNVFIEWRHLSMGTAGVSSVTMGARF